MIRRTVFFFGRVQGVGFRYTACHVASAFSVRGYVRNLSDGSVEAVVEGLEADVSSFLAELSRTMSGHIRETRVQDSPATGEFMEFNVRT
jgi:acylphosphatase